MILLDTHIWLWWVNGDAQLKPAWVERIAQADRVGVSIMSCLEVAWLEHHGRIELPCPRREWFTKSLEGSGIDLIPLSGDIVSLAVDLPEHHRDPQDRLIIASALHHQARLISADGKFRLYAESAALLID